MAKIISCEEVMSKLYEYLDSEVDSVTEADIDHHLHHCRECFSRAEFERLLRKKVASVGEKKAPAEVRQRLSNLIKGFSEDKH